METLLEWTDKQTDELQELADTFFKNESVLKELTEKKSVLKSKIFELLNTYSKDKMLTEKYMVSKIRVKGSKTLDNKKLVAKLKEFDVDIDDNYYKISAGYDRLDVKETSDNVSKVEEDPHRVTIIAADLEI